MASKDTCPVCATAEIVCGKWTLLVIRDLAEGAPGFASSSARSGNQPADPLAAPPGARGGRGRQRHTYPEVPPRVEYALTEKGRALVPLIEDMRTYGRQWLGCDEVDESIPDADATERRPAVAAA